MSIVSPITLRAETLACEISPALGGSILSLQWHGADILRRAPLFLTSARQSGSYPLVPWSNRIAGGRMQWRGKHVHLPTSADDPHCIHGIGWRRPWRVDSCASDSAQLSLEHAADAWWPYSFRCEQRFVASPDWLDISMVLTQLGDEPAPAGLGWHPFFALRAGATVHFHATGRWEMSPAMLPTHAAAHRGLSCSCEELEVDHCFEGWDGRAELRDPHLRVVLTSSLPRIVAFTRPGRNSIALEPVSHANNALGEPALGTPDVLGLVMLEPGERFGATMRIAMDGPDAADAVSAYEA